MPPTGASKKKTAAKKTTARKTSQTRKTAAAVEPQDVDVPDSVIDEHVHGEAETIEQDAVEVDEDGATVVEQEGPTLAEVERDEAKMMLVRHQPAPAPTALPSAAEWKAAMAMAESICQTNFVPSSYRGKPDEVLAAILAGRELGIGPMQALKDIHMIDGRPALAAHLQLAMLRKGGVQILDSESTNERAVIHARRKDTGEEATIEWTIEEADRADLTKKKNWRSYPADMLWSRAVGRLTRRIGSDLVIGMPYTAEEVADFELQNADEDYKAYERDTIRESRKDLQQGVPRSFAQINELAAQYGPEIGWATWMADCSELLFKKRRGSELSNDERAILGQKASGAILRLGELHPATEFPPPGRGVLQQAWASVLDGVCLPGPEWAMSAEETETHPPFPAPDALVAAQDAPGGDRESGPSAEADRAEAGAEELATGFAEVDTSEADALEFGGDGDYPT